MKTTTVKARQTLYDIALEQYGTCEAVGELLALNPGIANDPEALRRLGIETLGQTGFYLDAAVAPGTQLRIDEQSALMRKGTLKEIISDITTYDHGTND